MGNPGKFGKSKSHAVYGPWEDLHLSVGAYDGGKCVGPHQGYYTESDSCSYRWQAVHRATTQDSSVYREELYAGAKAANSMFRTMNKSTAGKMHSRGALNAPPTEKGKKSTIASLPFRTGFYPWNNNVHHLLPDAELKGGIFGVAGELPEAQDLIIKGLLENKYNINHWKNTMILPQDQEIGCALSLPIHPHGDDHSKYSAQVRAAVDGVLAAYEPIVAEMKAGTFEEDHEVPKPLDIVDALVEISDTLHTQVLALESLVRASCQASDSIAINQFASQVATALGV